MCWPLCVGRFFQQKLFIFFFFFFLWPPHTDEGTDEEQGEEGLGRFRSVVPHWLTFSGTFPLSFSTVFFLLVRLGLVPLVGWLFTGCLCWPLFSRTIARGKQQGEAREEQGVAVHPLFSPAYFELGTATLCTTAPLCCLLWSLVSPHWSIFSSGSGDSERVASPQPYAPFLARSWPILQECARAFL